MHHDIPARQGAYGSSNTKLMFMNNVKFEWYEIMFMSELLTIYFLC
jgi:hypothetical protein